MGTLKHSVLNGYMLKHKPGVQFGAVFTDRCPLLGSCKSAAFHVKGAAGPERHRKSEFLKVC